MSLVSADLPSDPDGTEGVRPSISERIGRGDRRAAGSKARGPAAYLGNREAQIPDRQAAADAIRPLFGATGPANRNARIAVEELKAGKAEEISKAATEDR